MYSKLCVWSLLSIIFASSVQSIVSSDHVPVMLWNLSEDVELPALQSLNKDAFKRIIESNLKNNTYMLVFVESALSPEDMHRIDDSSKASIFKPLIETMGKNSIKYIPNVESPTDALRSVSAKMNSVAASFSATGLSVEPEPEAGAFYMLFFHDSEDEDRTHLLQKHIQIICWIYNQVVKRHEDVLVIYTAKRPYLHTPNVGFQQLHSYNNLTGRYLTKVLHSVLYDSTLMIYMDYFPVLEHFSKKGKREYQLAQPVFRVVRNNTDKFHNELQFDGTNFTFRFGYKLVGKYWQIPYVFLRKVKQRSIDRTARVLNLFAPLGQSVRCGRLVVNISPYRLILKGLQVQPLFDLVKAVRFGPATDCIGYTTVPIWCGLLVSFLLLTIMAFGITMILNIKRIEQFEDPLKKTLEIREME